MTALSACQSAATKLNQPRPATVYGATTPFAQELADLANETATAIAKAHDWRRLTTLATITGDGSDTSFALPSDYDRMPLDSNVYGSLARLPFLKARDLDQWLEFDITPVVGAPGYWINLGGEIQIKPAMASTQTARYYYQSNIIVSGSKTAFTTDTDTFLLPERLLTLGIVWRWKSQKGLEYAEHLKNYEIAFGEEAGRDKGSRILYMGQPRIPDGASIAYPGYIA